MSLYTLRAFRGWPWIASHLKAGLISVDVRIQRIGSVRAAQQQDGASPVALNQQIRQAVTGER